MKESAPRNRRRRPASEDAHPEGEKHAGNNGGTGPREVGSRRIGDRARDKSRSTPQIRALQPNLIDRRVIYEAVLFILLTLAFLVSATEVGTKFVSECLLFATVAFICYLLIGQYGV